MKPAGSRTTVKLIEELDAEAPKFTHVLLAVGFDHTTVFVRADDPNRLNALNDAVSAGGKPVGLIGLMIGGGHASFSRRALREYAEEEWAISYLDNLIGQAAEELHQAIDGKTNGWITYGAGPSARRNPAGGALRDSCSCTDLLCTVWQRRKEYKMSRTFVNALVIRNDGNTAVLKPQEGPDQDVTFSRGEESPREFLHRFPSQGMVQLFHPEGRLAPEEEKNPIANWTSVKVLSNNGEEALLRFPDGEKVKFYRGYESQSDFLKSWPTGEMAEFKILAVKHGV
jgi:hypothetical protein